MTMCFQVKYLQTIVRYTTQHLTFSPTTAESILKNGVRSKIEEVRFNVRFALLLTILGLRATR